MSANEEPDIAMRYSLSKYLTALALLGLSAAFLGPWVERKGPRVTATAAGVLFGTGLLIGGLGLLTHQSAMVFVGMGLICGIGCGLGYDGAARSDSPKFG